MGFSLGYLVTPRIGYPLQNQVHQWYKNDAVSFLSVLELLSTKSGAEIKNGGATFLLPTRNDGIGF